MQQNNHKSINDFQNVDYENLLDYFATLSAEEYLIISSLIGLMIARSVSSTSKQNSLGNFFIQVGQTIITITAQDLTNSPNTTSTRLDHLSYEIEQIKRRLNM